MTIRGLLVLESKTVLGTIIQYELLESMVNLLDPEYILPALNNLSR